MQVVVPAGCVEGSIFEMLVPIQRESALPPISETPSPGLQENSYFESESFGDGDDEVSQNLKLMKGMFKDEPIQALPSLDDYNRRGTKAKPPSDDGSFLGKLRSLLESYKEGSDSAPGDEVTPVKTFPASLEEVTATQILKRNFKNLLEGNTVTAPVRLRDEDLGFKSKLPPIAGGAKELEEENEPYEEYLFERIKSAAFFGTWSMIIVLATIEVMLKISQSTPYLKWFPDFLKSLLGER
jgi:hypothetical protein